MTGTTAPAPAGKIELALAPYESRVLILHSEKAGNLPPATHAKTRHGGDPAVEGKTVIDLSRDWKVTFSGIGQSTSMSALQSWTDSAATRYYSGEAVYEKDFLLPSGLAHGEKLVLDFGDGTSVEKPESNKPGMRAWLESPVREAATVLINGRPAGMVWHPPYRLEVSSLLRPGNNHLEIRVYNLAINTLAGRTLPDYRLLNSRYGQRFQPQDTENLQPLPSGVLGPIRLQQFPD
jgi:hypothetical protein